MKIITYSLGQMQANCYVLVEGEECIIIDPADEAGFLLEELSRQRLILVGLVATHGHFDHVMAIGEIQLSYDIPLFIHKEDIFLLERLGETAKHFLGYDPIVMPVKKIEQLKIGNNKIGPFVFEVIHTPGHTPGSCCIYFKKNDALFTGDTLFKESVGRYDFSYSDKKLLKQSVKKLLQLPEQTEVYSGHGEETMIVNEKDVMQIFG